MVDVNSDAFKAANGLLSAVMITNLLRHTSLDDETRKAIPTQMEALTLQIIEAYEAAKPSGWLPIESAPIYRDGRHLIGTDKYGKPYKIWPCFHSKPDYSRKEPPYFVIGEFSGCWVSDAPSQSGADRVSPLFWKHPPIDTLTPNDNVTP